MSAFGDFVNEKEYNIWRYNGLYEERIEAQNRLTLGEGWTKDLAVEPLAKCIGLENIYFKREDLNPTGSHKDRSIAYLVSKALQSKEKRLVISSSGNAAVSAAAYCALAGIELSVFISPKTNSLKVRQIKAYRPNIVVSPRSIGLASYACKKFNIQNLRPSVNDDSIEGFKSIGFEIFERLSAVDAIFTFTTSGSSFLGIWRAFETLRREFGIDSTPALHAVHAGSLGPVAEDQAITLVGTLTGGVTRRARDVRKAAGETGGRLWPVTDKQVLEAADMLRGYGITTSLEGYASFSALLQASKEMDMRNAVCILTGHSYQALDIESLDSGHNETEITSEDQIDEIFSRPL